jgi:hypothetical protein
MLQSVELGRPAILLSSARFDQQPDEAGHRGMNLKEEIMAHTLYGHLVSTETLIRIGLAFLSLYSIGTAFAHHRHGFCSGRASGHNSSDVWHHLGRRSGRGP